MTELPEGVPITKTRAGQPVVETRPLYIEEWLEGLPYMNFKQTSHLLSSAIRASNDVAMKSSKRIELIGLYDSAYRYMVENQVKVGEQHALETVETEHEQLESLKQIAASQARSCRIAMEDTVHNQNTSWLKTKPPLESTLSAIVYLSHALLYSYMEYLPTPKNAWKELHFLYRFAEDMKKQDLALKEISENKQTHETTIEDAYKRIILTSMVDYHHLPFGAIWEVYQLLGSWTHLASIEPYKDTNDEAGLFVFDLANDVKPVPMANFNKELAEGRDLRVLNAKQIHNKVCEELKNLENDKALSDEVHIASQYARNVLVQISRYWGSPPKRYTTRTKTSGSIVLALGMNPAHYFLNKKINFEARTKTPDDDSIDVMQGAEPSQSQQYQSMVWELINQSSGGMALSLAEKPLQPVKVGDLVSVKIQDENANSHWVLGTIRWLLIRYNRSYQIGIEILSRKAKAVGVKTNDQNEFIRGFAFNMNKTTGSFSIISSRGTFQPHSSLNIRLGEQATSMTMSQLKENNALFEYFEVNPS